jgi:hypothetical protein
MNDSGCAGNVMIFTKRFEFRHAAFGFVYRGCFKTDAIRRVLEQLLYSFAIAAGQGDVRAVVSALFKMIQACHQKGKCVPVSYVTYYSVHIKASFSACASISKRRLALRFSPPMSLAMTTPFENKYMSFTTACQTVAAPLKFGADG